MSNMTEQDVPAEVASANLTNADSTKETSDSPVAETANVMEKERAWCEPNEQQKDSLQELQELEVAGTAGLPLPEIDSKNESEEQKPNLAEAATNSNDASLSAHTTTQLPNDLPTTESLLQSANEFPEPILLLDDPTVVPTTDMSQLSQEMMNGLIAAYSKPQMDFDQSWQQPLNGHPEPYSSENEQHALPPTGFAKLEFPDGHFYMTTYAVELGRDMRAYKYARRHTMIEGGVATTTRPQRSASLGDTPQTPGKGVKVNGSASIARSFVSESGGIIGEEDGHFVLPNEKRRRKKNTKKSKSTDSGLTQVSRKHSIDIKEAPLVDPVDTIAPATVDPNATAKLNPSEHMGDPHYTPLIPIHPPFDPSNPGKGISRKHVKIFYNFDTGRFEMEVLGRNGAFHDDQHYAQGSVVPLHDGSDIQIGGVNLTFVLPTVPVDDGQGEPSESVSGRMSFTFEDGRGESVMASEESDDNRYESYDDTLLPHPVDAYDYEDDDEDESVEPSIEQTSEEDEDDDEDEEHETKPVMTKPRRGRPKKHPMQDLPSKSAATRSINDSNKRRTTIKITMSKRRRAKAEDRERAERGAAERRAREKARTELATKAARRDSTKENIHDTIRGPPKEAAKEPSKASIVNAQNGEQEKPSRLARDEAMQNGVDFYDPKLPPGFVVPPRKRGPGRPPKDGVMSKREKALLIRQAKEEEKARKMGLDPTKLPPPESKAKAQTRRNSKGEVIEEKVEENGDEQKSVRPPRPPRSPSPEMKIEDYTEEQMLRPNANYVILIYEAIKGSKTGRMNLQQIYSAIERRYPFFKFKVTSSGWQSSVRHNLSQHDAFVQVEKDGKGWLWGIKEGVPIERERRKKTPPLQQPPAQHPPPNRFPQQPYPFNGYPSASNRASQHGPTPSYTYQPSRFFPPSLSQSTEAKSQSYSSPYASDKPAEGANASATASSGLARPSYAPPSYSRPPSYAAPPSTSTVSTTPPFPQNSSSTQSQQLTKLSGSRTYRPSADVVETFRKVFVDSYQRKALGMTPSDALEMVNRAIKRVLEPDSVTGVQGSADEMTVALAFENCIAKSQGPPRHVAPTGVMMGTGSAGQGQGGGRESPTLATSIAMSAAITAAEKTVPQNQGQGVRSTTPTEPTPAEQQDHAKAQRPAETNLLNLLTGAPSTSSPSTTAQLVSDDRTPTPGSLDSAKVNGIARILEHASRLNGMGVTPMRPDIEPLTPPAPSLTPQPQIGAKRGAEEDGEAAVKRVKVDDRGE